MTNHIELEMQGRKVKVMGGPYRSRPQGIKSVKLAQEIDASYNVKLDIPDFRTPDPSEAYVAAIAALYYLRTEQAVFVGCMGGMGRTGLFMAILIKALGHYNYEYESTGWRGYKNRVLGFFGRDNGILECELMQSNPVEVVRSRYNNHAVETSDQYNFVSDFDWDNSTIDFWELEKGNIPQSCKVQYSPSFH